MALTPSTMLDLMTPLPAFSLPDLNGGAVSDRDFRSAPALLVAFLCPHCPYVKHVRQAFATFAAEYQGKGLAVVAINSNDVGQYPEDGPEGMRTEAREARYTFPYLYDESQQTAKSFRAACTPDFFLFDKDRRLVYRGQFDESRPSKDTPVTGEDLRRAADAALAGREVSSTQRPSVGCNIKWKLGNEPTYS
jgi:thiol-disulfide isomerase/thioredoxin